MSVCFASVHKIEIKLAIFMLLPRFRIGVYSTSVQPNFKLRMLQVCSSCQTSSLHFQGRAETAKCAVPHCLSRSSLFTLPSSGYKALRHQRCVRSCSSPLHYINILCAFLLLCLILTTLSEASPFCLQ